MTLQRLATSFVCACVCSAAFLPATGCSTQTVSRAGKGKTDAELLPPPAPGMQARRVVVGRISISPAVVIPDEMQTMTNEDLATIAREHLQHELGAGTAFELRFSADSNPTPAPGEFLLVGDIVRMEISGSVEDQLTGLFGRQRYSQGESVQVRRDMALEMNCRILNTDNTPISVGTGSAILKIPISGTVRFSHTNENGKATSQSTLTGGKVDQSALATAFRRTANSAAIALINNANQRYVLAQQQNQVHAKPEPATTR